MCVCVALSCVGRGLGAGLIPHPKSPTKYLKGSISKKKNPTPEKGIRKRGRRRINSQPVHELLSCFIIHRILSSCIK
jgi:hypothetical protein